MAGRAGLSLETIDKLAELLGLSVLVRRRRRKRED
jgi:hypothetical protein